MGKYLKLYETESQFDQNEGNGSSVAIMYKGETVNIVNPDLDNHPSRQRVSFGVRNGEIVAMCGEVYDDYDQSWYGCYDGTDICSVVSIINNLGLPTSQLNVSNGDHICFEFSVGQVPGKDHIGVTAVSSYKCILTGETGKTTRDEYRDVYYKVFYKEGDSTQRLYAIYRVDAGIVDAGTNRDEVYEVLNAYETYDNASLTGDPIGCIFKMENEDIINETGKVVTSVVPGVAYTDDEKNVYYNGGNFHVTVKSYAEVKDETTGNRETVLVETAVYDSPDVDMLTLFGPAMDYYVEHMPLNQPESGPYGYLEGQFTSGDINPEEEEPEEMSEGLEFGGCSCCFPTKEAYMSAIIGGIYNHYSSMHSYNALTQMFRPSANGKTFSVRVGAARC